MLWEKSAVGRGSSGRGVADDSSSLRDWIKIGLALLALGVTVAIPIVGMMNELQRTTIRHDTEHIEFRHDIIELDKLCRASCQK